MNAASIYNQPARGSPAKGPTVQQVAGVVVALVGLLVVVGWVLGIPVLPSLIPGWLTMKVNTSLGFVLLGVALLLSQMSGSRAQGTARVCVLLVGFGAALTLLEYATGWNIGIDEILFRDTMAIAGAPPGRMATNTAICFLLTASGIWLMCRPSRSARRIVTLQWLGLLTMALGFFALFGSAGTTSLGYNWWGFAGMAVHTALLFILLGAALFRFAWRESETRWLIGPGRTLEFFAGLVVLLAVTLHSSWNTKQLVTAAASQNREEEIIVNLHALRSYLDESQSGVRGFVITGEDAFLTIADVAQEEVPKVLKAVRALLAKRASNQAQFDALEKAVFRRLEFSQEVIALRRASGFDPVVQANAARKGKAMMDGIRASLAEMDAGESRLALEYEAQADAFKDRTLAVLPGGLLLSALLLSLSLLRLNNEMMARQRDSVALKRSERRLSLALEAAEVGAWELDLDTKHAERSLRHDQLFGYAEMQPEWTFDTFLRHVHPEDLARVSQEFQKAFAKGEDWSVEFRNIRPDHTEGWLWARGRFIKDTTGRLSEIFGLVGDMTQRKQAEQALRDSAALQRDILNSLPSHIALLNREGTILTVNQPWLQFARENGSPELEKIGVNANYLDACRAACEAGDLYAQAALDGLQSVLSGEQSRFTLEYPVSSPEGKSGWFVLDVTKSAGGITGAIVGHRDVSERRRAQQLLAWEKSALELISSKASLYEVLEGFIISLEKQLPSAICTVLLLDPDGIHLRHGAAPSLPESYRQAIEGLAIGPAVGSCGTAIDGNRQVIVVDIATDPLWKDYRDLALSHGLRACWSTPIHGFDGKILGSFAIYYRAARSPNEAERDLITRAVHVTRIAIERKYAEEQIIELNASLETRVTQRTAQLETANRELEAFTYSVSHDLRAPLRAIDGFSRMMLEDYSARLDANGQRVLGVIRSESQRMARLIDDLLTFSRLGRQQMEPTRIDIQALAQAIFDEQAASEPERKMRFELHALPVVWGTLPMIRQLWVNLISNALKFTKKRQVAEIEIGTQPADDGSVIFYIKDNGAGFDMRYAGKLFGVFQRLHSQMEFEGTGVGLALVQRIVYRCQGRIWAEAEVDRGATFYFTLPDREQKS